MNPDGTSDKNLLNFYGPQHDGTVQDYTGATLSPPGADYTGIVKATSGVNGVSFLGALVIGARETACDVNNRASHCRFIADVWDVRPCKYGFSNKGGSLDNLFRGTVRGRSKECEFFQDNWSDQNHDPSTATLDLRPEDGKTPIRVRYLHKRPVLVPGSGPYVFLFPWPWLPLPRSWIGAIFSQLRRWGLFR